MLEMDVSAVVIMVVTFIPMHIGEAMAAVYGAYVKRLRTNQFLTQIQGAVGWII
jgi:hypothetical protein